MGVRERGLQARQQGQRLRVQLAGFQHKDADVKLQAS
jgi:hypothetical protein